MMINEAANREHNKLYNWQTMKCDRGRDIDGQKSAQRKSMSMRLILPNNYA